MCEKTSVEEMSKAQKHNSSDTIYMAQKGSTNVSKTPKSSKLPCNHEYTLLIDVENLKKSVKPDAKFVEEAQSRLSHLDSKNQISQTDIKKLVTQRYALFLQDSEAKYEHFVLVKDLPDAAKEFQAGLFLSLSECRKDMDEMIGHELVERLFGSDLDIAALYHQ